MEQAAYLVSKFVNTIKKEMDFERYKAKNTHWHQFVVACSSYEEAKRYLINRAELKILSLQDEIRKLKRTLPKLMALKEKLNSEPNPEECDATGNDSSNANGEIK